MSKSGPLIAQTDSTESAKPSQVASTVMSSYGKKKLALWWDTRPSVLAVPTIYPFVWEVEKVSLFLDGWLCLCLHLSFVIIQNIWTMLPRSVYKAMKASGLSKVHFCFVLYFLSVGVTRFKIVVLLSQPIDLLILQFKHFKSCQ